MGSGEYLRDCPGTADDVATFVPAIAEAHEMVFRTNRDVIVLNDLKTGLILLVNENMQEVDNWTQVEATLDTSDEVSEEVSENDVSVAADPEDNTDPVANPDDFGVRPGRTNWLPVLANDQDPDGDILTADVVSQPQFGNVQRVSQGEALQIVVPDDASGSVSFDYRAEDGRGGQSESTVTVSVHDWEVNDAPRPLRYPRVTVAQGGSITYNLINDWFDPDGDMVFLESAESPDGLAVESRPDGTVTINDLGGNDPGLRSIPVFVTDGRETATAEIQLDLRDGKQNQAPIANSDHYSAPAGQALTVNPLVNDTDPNGDEIRLVSIDPEDVEATSDPSSGLVTLRSDNPGSYYLSYSVSDRKAESAGMIRFDVFEANVDQEPPAAQPDIGLLPPEGSVLVDLTANDTDPTGGVLVVQSIEVPEDTGLSVQLIDHRLARIAAPAGLEQQVSFSYTVSNGHGDASADVIVTPLPVQSTDQPPTAVDDVAMVRAGDLTTVDVLANDISPAQLELELDHDVAIISEQTDGIAFVGGDKLRFRAGPNPGTVRITYTVRDSVGGFSSGTVTVTVVSNDDPNDPPNPGPLDARTFAGTAVRVPVPTVGVDPDGDSVVISGLAMPGAQMGSVTIGEGFFEYTPNPDASGTDVFGYTVMDRFGATGVGLVYVGVSPLPTVNQAPFASPDTVDARPGRMLAVPVTANDFDPDGDQVQIVPDSVQAVDGEGAAEVTVRDNRIELTTPDVDEDTVLRYYYDAADGRGGVARGLLTVNVSQNAPLLYPNAKDDSVTVADTFGQSSVLVDVLANDDDPDGASADLRLTSSDHGVSVTAERKLEVPVGADRQIIIYAVTDPDDQTAYAAVSVPGEAQQRPILTAENIPVKVTAGDPIELKLSDYVRVRAGHSPQLTFADLVQVSAGSDGTPPVK
ncbi:MAG: tandem-95 repeat protein, partial [Propionibacterium sp.]|nr:tandem-95 repeat protein [Propionibacterium sp.]